MPGRKPTKRTKKPGRPKSFAVAINVRIPGELEARLRAVADREERQFADVVRRALVRGVEVLEGALSR